MFHTQIMHKNGLKRCTSLTCLLFIFKPVIVIFFFFSGHNMYINARAE